MIHAGADYEQNIRLHCYLYSPFLHHNRSWIIQKHANEYFQKYCVRITDKKKS